MITPICPSSTPRLNEIRLIINAPSETPISFKIPAKPRPCSSPKKKII
jgi:hypothetical protein